MHDFFAQRTIARWVAYAVTFGLLWGLVANALIFGDGASTSVARGAIGGVLFATLALARERRGPFRRRPPRP
jgi:drug/metabolite transporter (DMT)-like permease